MLPPGHIAGGYIVALGYVAILQPDIPAKEIDTLLTTAAFFAFAPDLDMFITFFRQRSARLGQKENNHRYLVTHTPFFWLLVSASFAVFTPKPFGWHIASVVFLGALSHLILDSIQFGIMWLYPVSRRVYALRDRAVEFHLPPKGFVAHWTDLVIAYARRFTLTFVLEIILIITAVIAFFIV